MGNMFTIVLVGAIALFVFIGLMSYVSGGDLYEQIGQGGMSIGDGATKPSAVPAPGSEQARQERELEIRQMLQARSDRLVRNGGQALDIDAELARLEGPATNASGAGNDPGLAEEVRQLVVARNERRARAGEDPLDVESEVQRTLSELDPDGR